MSSPAPLCLTGILQGQINFEAMINEIVLSSEAEKRAEKAENLKAFSGFKLLDVKNQIAKILALIGHDDIFDDYSKYELFHIDCKLESLEWLVPVETRSFLTSSDWLMMVLSLYFRNLGMLVTHEEFKDRNNNEPFNKYKSEVLDGKFGIEFKNQVSKMLPENQDKFLYREYVGRTFSERVQRWIIGGNSTNQKKEMAVVKEVQKLLAPLPIQFKSDLALLCEIPNPYDVNYLEKHKVMQSYGENSDEIVNVQNVARTLLAINFWIMHDGDK